MIETDMVCQWLVGDTLKQNQLKFLYDVQNTLYNTAVKYQMLDEKKNMGVFDNVVPHLCTYMTMRNMLRIQRQKADDELKEHERQKRKAVLMAETGMSYDEVEEPEIEAKESKNKSKSKKKQEEIDPAELERQKQAALKAKDIATYGVSTNLSNI